MLNRTSPYTYKIDSCPGLGTTGGLIQIVKKKQKNSNIFAEVAQHHEIIHCMIQVCVAHPRQKSGPQCVHVDKKEQKNNKTKLKPQKLYYTGLSSHHHFVRSMKISYICLVGFKAHQHTIGHEAPDIHMKM